MNEAAQEAHNYTNTSRKTRISKACQTCSIRRRKCDGDQPKCSICQRLGVECVYVNTGKRRGRPSTSTTDENRQKGAFAEGPMSTKRRIDYTLDNSDGASIDHSAQAIYQTPSSSKATPISSGNDVLEHLTALLISWEATDRRESNTIPLKLLSPSKVRFHFDIFWRHVHTHWQILYKPAFTAIPETRLADEVEQPLLEAIVCLTASMAIHTERDRSTVEAICQTATVDLLTKLLTPDLSVVQALFLHSLRFYGIGDLKKASLFTSCAWQLCVDLGMHIDDRSGHRDPGKHQARLRALWTCYCLDKVLAAEMERVPAFRSDGVTAELLSEYEPDEFEIVYQNSDLIPEFHGAPMVSLGRLHAASSLNLTVRLYRILEQALLSPVHLHPDKTVSEQDLLSSWTRTLALDRELDALAGSWPDQFRLHTRNELAVPGVACLVVWFHLIKVINYRPYVLLQDRLFRTPIRNADMAPSAQIAAMCCLTSASAIVQLFNAIPRTSLRYIAANNAFSIFTAASILMPYSTHESLSIAKECHQSVHKCLAWLDDLGETWPIARKHRMALDDMAQLLQISLDDDLEMSTTIAANPNMDGNAVRQQETGPEYIPAGGSDSHESQTLGLSSLHSKATSPLGFRGQLALRPFSESVGENVASVEQSASSSSYVTDSDAGRRHGRNESSTSMAESQPDLLNFLHADSDATSLLDELCLDPSIQALVRQSLSRDTSLWESTAFKAI
ncbi:uncharacterized protein FA14DRAFT_76999 [Meira miltonrushii]|uniref:Zn(2)-C6 fungal-type domain-containing protein n=1 Tax=Meira miltonrushii TaxID=1280837 RepID=A0A316V6P6_9BASI|nr:uncharacterized protein FA14DRAFT_76999 [Meira miltonrushii]PWN32708.1 hypothetical protein FA14DRAFT_76999 [Meira miltonrushii]